MKKESDFDLSLYDSLINDLRTTSVIKLTKAVKIIFNGFYKEKVLSKKYFDEAIITIYNNNKESFDMLFENIDSNKNFGKRRAEIMKNIITEKGRN